jgi:hypothetical protein
MSQPSARERLFSLLRDSLAEDSFVKLTLGKPAPTRTDATLHNVFVRPVALKTGPHLTFVFRHATRDVTKNYTPADALDTIESLLGLEFLDAHLFTAAHAAQLETQPDGSARVRVKAELEPLSGEGNGLSALAKGFGCLRGRISMSPDFDSPLEDFKDYAP